MPGFPIGTRTGSKSRSRVVRTLGKFRTLPRLPALPRKHGSGQGPRRTGTQARYRGTSSLTNLLLCERMFVDLEQGSLRVTQQWLAIYFGTGRARMWNRRYCDFLVKTASLQIPLDPSWATFCMVYHFAHPYTLVNNLLNLSH